MDAVYPAGASALARGRRLRRGPQRARTRTTPVTFAEIKEVDEESGETGESGGDSAGGRGGDSAGGRGGEERRRRDELVAPAPPLARQFADSRRRRARRDVIPEPPEESCSSGRASSEPRAQPAP